MDRVSALHKNARMAKQRKKQTLLKPRNRIRELRELHDDMTQEELAELLGKSRGVIAQYESGETKLGEDVIFKLAEIFDVPISAILKEEKPMNPSLLEIISDLSGASETDIAKAIGFVKGLKVNRP